MGSNSIRGTLRVGISPYHSHYSQEALPAKCKLVSGWPVRGSGPIRVHSSYLKKTDRYGYEYGIVIREYKTARFWNFRKGCTYLYKIHIVSSMGAGTNTWLEEVFMLHRFWLVKFCCFEFWHRLEMFGAPLSKQAVRVGWSLWSVDCVWWTSA